MYKTWSESEIRKVLNDIGIKMGMSCENVPVIISGRMTSTKGQFTFTSKKINGVNTIVPVNFKFAKSLLDGNYSEDVVKETILHEYAHLYTNLKYNRKHGHDAFFKRVCKRIGISDETYFTAEPLEKVACRESNIIEIKCKCCGEVVATRKRKDSALNLLSDRYTSRCCNARLIL